MNATITIAAFAAGFLLVFGANLLLADVASRRRRQVLERLDSEMRRQQRQRTRSTVQKDLSQLAAEGRRDSLSRPTWNQRLGHWIDQSGLRMRPATLVCLSLATGLMPMVVAGLLMRSFAAALITLAAGVVVPFRYVAFRRRRRSEKMLSQLPDAFNLMSRMLRAGQTIPQSLQGIADEFSPPVSSEFSYCYEQQNLGLSVEAALRDLAHRTGLVELKIFVVAVAVHRQTGGNLSELLDKLATVIRDRHRIRGQVKALTAEGRMQATILLALPPLLMGVIAVVNRPYLAALFQFPTLIVGMFVFEILGALWLRKLVQFEF
jgi:tight adherence protein B